MTQPQIVYLVSAITVAGLVAWVIMVLLKAPKLEPAGGPSSRTSAPPKDTREAPEDRPSEPPSEGA